MLETALDRGWDEVRGVEPSAEAIAQADPRVRELIVADIMRPGLLPDSSFDAVTLFQVLDHMPDPAALLRECRSILRPGGAILAFNHNVTAWSARLLRERSPIIDVEHTALFDRKTFPLIFKKCGFHVRSVFQRRAPVRLSRAMTKRESPPSAL